MFESLTVKIKSQVEQIDEDLSKVHVLIEKCTLQDPDYIELLAASAALHAYYNGLENIFLLVLKNIDCVQLTHNSWHSDLLSLVAERNDKRPAVIDSALKAELALYCKYRHFFRHAYGINLEWQKEKPLFLDMENNWSKCRAQILAFCTSLTGK